jgi:hypothetical protein
MHLKEMYNAYSEFLLLVGHDCIKNDTFLRNISWSMLYPVKIEDTYVVHGVSC